MATAGGAEVLGIDAGQFRKGFSFDAIVVDTAPVASNVYIDEALDEPEDVLQKIVYNASKQNISRVWVRGRQVRGELRIP
jgi:guanine deaminase